MDLTVGPNVVVGESEHLYECLDLRVVPEGGERWGSEEDPGSVLGRHHGVCQPLGGVCRGVSVLPACAQPPGSMLHSLVVCAP